MAPHSTGAVLVMETNRRKEGQALAALSSCSLSARRLWRTMNTAAFLGPPQAVLVACPCIAGCYQCYQTMNVH